MAVISEVTVSQIETLLYKVEEVINNNDWPTEEGKEREGTPECFIRRLVNAIREGIPT